MNGKIWEKLGNLYKSYKEGADESEKKLASSSISLVKTGILLVFLFIILIFSAIAWFASNRSVTGTGMGASVQDMPYTIQTRSGSGTYNSIYNSLNTGGMEWKISAGYNFDNHASAIEEGEDEPGIEPGDSGKLEFRVNPNIDNSITVDCVFDIKVYLQSVTPIGNGETETVINEINGSAVKEYVNSHIMLFTGQDPDTHKYTGLIGNDESMRRVLTNQTYTRNGETYTTIYWVWPKFLSNLISNNNSEIIYAPTERSAVIQYIANNKNGFFKDCNDSVSQVASDLTSLSTAYSNSIFNRYNMKYDNADLEIGNNASYVLLSMKVETGE
ncbi:MAG: hypothetical protein E7254_06640 [Lachnospiraceae bacterium]|nr:hypothetical protein [Lachnospiraceae bacterium]